MPVFLFIAALQIVGVQASPTPAVTASPRPTPLPEIGHVEVHGRRANLIGTAQAASTGTISQEEISTRPLLRPGEILETIPGVVISQHSGEGKANQYYLRGFQLDHGTDLESTVNGEPINLPSHAHGQGYSDINWLIPELVEYVEYKKGPYYADQGDFSTAGSYNLTYRNTISPLASISVGDFGYARLFVAGSHPSGSGNLLTALELVHDNGTFDRPDEYQKINGVIRYSRNTRNSEFNVTGLGYSGTNNSTDQIPQRLVDSGTLDRYSAIDPTDAGNTHRLSLTSEYTHLDRHGVTKVSAYGFDSFLDLFSNFTYSLDDATDFYNTTRNPVTCNAAYASCTPNTGSAPRASDYTTYCPANMSAPSGASNGSIALPNFTFSCGDQREQQDRRFVSGFSISRSFVTPVVETTLGVGTRSDNISTVGLYRTNDRMRYANGTLSQAHVVQRSSNIYAQSQVHVTKKLRFTGGLRGDLFTFHVDANDPQNSGRVSAGIVSPKVLAAYKLTAHQEIYGDYGQSFHSNDARGITQHVDPQTHEPFDPTGAPVAPVTPLVRAAGEEVGYRYANAKFNSSIALWQLNIASELVFNGDAGTTSPNGPTVRHGIEFANFYTPTKELTFDGDVAMSNAHFLTNSDGAGTAVPESINAVVSAGATIDKTHYAASLRFRYFGPRILTQDGTAASSPSTLLNGQFTLKGRKGRTAAIDLLNILNAQADDVEYNYASWVPNDRRNPAYQSNPAINPTLGGSGVTDYHFHPSEKRTVRLTLSTPL